MQYLNDLITETKNNKAKESLLVLQQYVDGAEATQDCRTFVNAMLRMCGTNKDRYTTYMGTITIGRIVDCGFECFLSSKVADPIVVPTYIEDEPQLILRDKHNTVVGFNLIDIQVKKIEVNEVGKNLVHYQFYLHSQYVGLDYMIDMTVKEVE